MKVTFDVIDSKPVLEGNAQADVWSSLFARIAKMVTPDDNAPSETDDIRKLLVDGVAMYMTWLAKGRGLNEYERMVAKHHCLIAHSGCRGQTGKNRSDEIRQELLHVSSEEIPQVVDFYKHIFHGFVVSAKGEGWLSVDVEMTRGCVKMSAGTAAYVYRLRKEVGEWISPVFDIKVTGMAVQDIEDPSRTEITCNDGFDMLNILWSRPLELELEQFVSITVDEAPPNKEVMKLSLVFHPSWDSRGQLSMAGYVSIENETNNQVTRIARIEAFPSNLQGG